MPTGDPSKKPSGVTVIHAPWSPTMEVERSSLFLALQRLIAPSALPDRYCVPSGEKAVANARPVEPLKVLTSLPFVRSHSLTVLPSPADRAVAPPGKKATPAADAWELTSKSRTDRPLARSQTDIFNPHHTKKQKSYAEKACAPFGEKATAFGVPIGLQASTRRARFWIRRPSARSQTLIVRSLLAEIARVPSAAKATA